MDPITLEAEKLSPKVQSWLRELSLRRELPGDALSVEAGAFAYMIAGVDQTGEWRRRDGRPIDAAKKLRSAARHLEKAATILDKLPVRGRWALTIEHFLRQGSPLPSTEVVRAWADAASCAAERAPAIGRSNPQTELAEYWVGLYCKLTGKKKAPLSGDGKGAVYRIGIHAFGEIGVNDTTALEYLKAAVKGQKG